jgi:hypothetical protein
VHSGVGDRTSPPPDRPKPANPDRPPPPAAAAMPEKAVDDVMEAAVGPHFSGLRIEALRLSSPSAPSSPSSARAATAAHSNGTVHTNGTASPAAAAPELASLPAVRQPFVIGRSFIPVTTPPCPALPCFLVVVIVSFCLFFIKGFREGRRRGRPPCAT